MLIGLVLPNGHSWREEAPGIGTVSFDGGIEDLTVVARAHLDVLLISATVLRDVPSGVGDLDRYRVTRSDVRVIVSYSPDSRPGDQVLGACLSMGIYDFAADGTPLTSVLATRATYADAVRWRLPIGSPAVSSGSVVVQEKPVIQDVSGVLTVFSSGGGNGKSTVSIHLAQAAAARGFRPALVEVEEEKPCHLLAFGEAAQKGKGIESLKEGDFTDPVRLQRQLQEVAVTTRSGVTLFPVASPHSEIAMASHEDMATLLSVLSRVYRPVIVDTTYRLKDAPTLGAVLNADKIILVMEPLRPVAESMAVVYRDILDIGVDSDKVALVLNNVDKSAQLKKTFIEELVGLPAVAQVPADAERYSAVFNSAKISLDGGAPWQELLESFMWQTTPNMPAKTYVKKARWPFSMFKRA